jgi:hypothetical protein
MAVSAVHPLHGGKDETRMLNVSISTATAGVIRSWPYHKEERLEEETLAAVRAGSNITTYDARDRAATRWCFTCTVRQAEDLQNWLDQSSAKLGPSRHVLAEGLAHAAADVRAALAAVSAPAQSS